MKIHEILKMSRDDYELLTFDWWLSFCLQKATREQDVQKLLSNNSLFQWWHAQLTQVEQEFIQDALPYKAIYTTNEAQKLYAKHVYKLQKYYNSNLIKQALQ